MGKLERDHSRRMRNGAIQNAVLKTIAVAGLVSVALLAPNVLQVLDQLGVKKRHRRSRMQSIYQSRTRLIERGLVEWDREKKGYLRLTEEGENRLSLLDLGYALKKPRRWDKKWRMLIFDIRERRKPLREKVRRTLQGIGFVRLQDSVWVYPYDCEDLINLLKIDFKIGKDLQYLIVDTIEDDRALRARFSLPSRLSALQG